uniref:Uncharacterized protein n=1 Tax=Anguilla anguilla TaxID=7936 RepID=A0A0E9XPZ5_ANGAN
MGGGGLEETKEESCGKSLLGSALLAVL